MADRSEYLVRNVEEMMSNFSEAIAHLEFPRRQRLHLMNLPQEIQDSIFDLAYPHINGFQFVTKEGWLEREQENFKRSHTEYTERPFPQAKAGDFLVSKKFFLTAARACIGNQTFNNTFEARREERRAPQDDVGVIWPKPMGDVCMP